MIDPVAAQEKFIKKVNKTLENVEEVEIEEDWEFLTEDEMRDANWPENLASNSLVAALYAFAVCAS